MLRNQYKVLAISLAVGFMWVGIHQVVLAWWFLARLSILLAVISFVPAMLVFIVHFREYGPFLVWDKSNVVLTTRRSRRLEKAEIIVMAVLWAVIFIFVVIAIFWAR
jgi:hypothetical protein